MASKEEVILDEMNTQAQVWAEEMAAKAGVPYACGKGNVFFTGWKGCPREMNISLVGQWLDYRLDPGEVYYVNLPNMNAGRIAEGMTFDIGIDRLRLGQKDGIKNMLQDGLDKLLSLSQEKVS